MESLRFRDPSCEVNKDSRVLPVWEDSFYLPLCGPISDEAQLGAGCD